MLSFSLAEPWSVPLTLSDLRTVSGARSEWSSRPGKKNLCRSWDDLEAVFNKLTGATS